LAPSSSSKIGVVSSPHIPDVKLHAPCDVEPLEMKDVTLSEINDILGPLTSLWPRDPVTQTYLWGPARGHYSSEGDVASVVLQLLNAVVMGLQKMFPNVRITLQQEKNIAGNQADIWIVLLHGHLVGCVEVKKPSQGKVESQKRDPLNHKLVLGQLYDYMKVIRSFYGTMPVWGIVTTFNEWRFCKLADPPVHDRESTEPESPPRQRRSSLCEKSPLPQLMTPSQGPDPAKEKRSPPRVSLSSGVSGRRISIDESEPADAEMEETEKCRKMSASKVYSCEQHRELLSVLGGVLLEMAQATTSILELERTIHDRALLFFTAGDVGFGWASPQISLRWNVFIHSSTKRVYAIDDLGHGRDGRVWLVCNGGGSVGVMKFVANEVEAEKEAAMWKKVYSGESWIKGVRHGKWSKRWAVVMPRFSQFRTQQERRAALPDIEEAMKNNFGGKGLRHRDVHWSNIGYFLEGNAKKKVVLFDLSDVPEDKNKDWIDASIQYLEDQA
jgi:hypothetical protein